MHHLSAALCGRQSKCHSVANNRDLLQTWCDACDFNTKNATYDFKKSDLFSLGGYSAVVGVRRSHSSEVSKILAFLPCTAKTRHFQLG